jgi:DNA-binding beta-propeller fold protein YncE
MIGGPLPARWDYLTADAPSKRAYVSHGSEVVVIDTATNQVVGRSGGANPDAITFDPSTQAVWVFNHTGKSATEIDAVANSVRATIALTGTAETGQADGAGKVFVNIEDKDQIDVIDVAARKVTASWSVAPGSNPTGMSLDRDSHRFRSAPGPMPRGTTLGPNSP